jgi:hypothetical protein
MSVKTTFGTSAIARQIRQFLQSFKFLPADNDTETSRFPEETLFTFSHDFLYMNYIIHLVYLINSV